MTSITKSGGWCFGVGQVGTRPDHDGDAGWGSVRLLQEGDTGLTLGGEDSPLQVA